MVILLLEADELVITAVAGQVPTSLVGTRVGIADTAGRRRPPVAATASGSATSRPPPLRAGRADRRQGRPDRPAHVPRRVVGVLEAFDRAAPASSSRPRTSASWRPSQRARRRRWRPRRTSPSRPAAQHRRVRPRAGALGARAARRDAAGAQRAQDHAQQRPAVGFAGRVREAVETALELQRARDPRPARDHHRPAPGSARRARHAGRPRDARRPRPRALRARRRPRRRPGVRGRRAATRHVPALESAVYRIAQEAITNTIKHAQATRVVVTLTERDDVVTLSVEDDGRGFDHRGSRVRASG